MDDIKINAELRVIQDKLEAQIRDLKAAWKEYGRRPDVQVRAGYLAKWFPSTINILEQWLKEIELGLEDTIGTTSKSLDHTLSQFTSLSYGLDVDLKWSGLEDQVNIRASEMSLLSRDMRRSLIRYYGWSW